MKNDQSISFNSSLLRMSIQNGGKQLLYATATKIFKLMQYYFVISLVVL